MTRDGTLTTIDGRPALRFERRYPHSVERVWQAISDPAEMKQWFPSDVVGDRSVGAKLTFADDAQRAAAQEAGEPTRADGPMFTGEVVAYDPPNVFTFTWGGELLRFELTADGSDTVLVFTQLLSHRSIAARNGAGWDQCLAALDGLLGVPADESRGWADVFDEYLSRMGPPLGQRGDDGSVIWERATHVDIEGVHAATSDPAKLEAWGASEHVDEPVDWDIEPTEHGSRYRLTHRGIDGDAGLAATWHALLIQLDMYLAAGQLVPISPDRWLPAYAAIV